jgi:hypothetical protein
MRKHPNPVSLREAWVLCFILGVIMLNFPFLQIFNKETGLFGFPVLFLYFFLGWPLSILVIYLFSRKIDHGAESRSAGEEPKQGRE